MKSKFNRSKIFQGVVLSILILVILAGSAFGLSQYYHVDSFSKETEFNVTTDVEVDVVNNYDDVYIGDIANNLSNQLEYFGYSNSNVSIVDNNTLKLSFTPNYINTTAYDKDNDVSDGVIYSNGALAEANKEFLAVFASLFYTGEVEFRSNTEDNLFVVDEFGNITFQEPSTPTTPSSDVTSSTPNPYLEDDQFDINAWTQVDDIDGILGTNTEDTYPVQLIDHAELEYHNGNTYVRVYPTEDAMPAFRNGATYIMNNYNEVDNPTGNVYTVWIGYDVLNSLISRVNPAIPTGGGNTLGYCLTDSNGNQTDTPREICQPFLLTYDEVNAEININADSFLIRDGFGKTHAQMVVDRINNASNHYAFKLDSVKYNESSSNVAFLKALLILYMVIILVSIFLFSWWMGMLGKLFSSVSVFTFFSALAIASATMVPIGLMFVFGQLLLLIFNLLLGNRFIRTIKNNLKLGYSRKEHYKSFGVQTGRTLFLLFIFVLPILVFFIIKLWIYSC